MARLDCDVHMLEGVRKERGIPCTCFARPRFALSCSDWPIHFSTQVSLLCWEVNWAVTARTEVASEIGHSLSTRSVTLTALGNPANPPSYTHG